MDEIFIWEKKINFNYLPICRAYLPGKSKLNYSPSPSRIAKKCICSRDHLRKPSGHTHDLVLHNRICNCLFTFEIGLMTLFVLFCSRENVPSICISKQLIYPPTLKLMTHRILALPAFHFFSRKCKPHRLLFMHLLFELYFSRCC